MGIFLLLLIFSPVRGIFEGACPRKDIPPDVLVLSPGSKLVLACDGHVLVNGVKFRLTGSSAGTNKRERSSNVTPAIQNYMHNSTVSVIKDNSSTQNDVSEPGENIYHDAGYTASPHITSTKATRSLKDRSNWSTEEMDVEGDFEGNGEGEGQRPQWKWNKIIVGKGKRDWGGITVGMNGSTISLAPLRLTDSGKYTCHHRGKEKFSVKVNVAESPESLKMFCYKRTPSSKIRCEGTTQKAVIHQPSCYLFLNKGAKEKFIQVPCSYSSQQSRCWCALEHNDDELSVFHSAYMCVTSISANVTSPLISFTLLEILKPDPPANVSVWQEEGQERWLTVSWNLPASWKTHDSYYKLIYTVKYSPVKPSLSKEQVIPIEGQRHITITDIMPGVNYLIQVRTKDEFDGHWSDWSTPVYARSWTKKPHPPSIVSVVVEEGQETMTITWSFSANLKEHSSFIYEIKYGPLDVNSTFSNEKVQQFQGKLSYTITDVMPDVEYLIQLRFKEEQASEWSDWSIPFHTWNIIDTMIGLEASNEIDVYDNGTESSPSNVEWVPHVLWIFSLFIPLSAILAIYKYRHKDKLISKFCNLLFTTHCGDSSQPSPSAPTAPEGWALVAVVPTKSNKKQPPSDEKESEENGEQELLKERIEAMHFNNTSYFLMQRE